VVPTNRALVGDLDARHDAASSGYRTASVYASASEVGEIEWDLRRDRWQWDLDAYNVFGALASEVPASAASLIALKHPDDLANCKAVMREIQLGRQRFSYAPRVFAENGTVRHITASGAVHAGPGGSPGILHAKVVALSDWVAPLAPADVAFASDASLMLAMRARIPEAFEEVYRRHSPRAIQLARYQLRSALASDDVVQDVFEGFFRAPDRFDARLGTLANYVRLQVRSRCWDIQRATPSRFRREASQIPANADPAEDEAFAALSIERVQAGLATLNPDVRRALELAFVDGFTYRDVARLLEIPEGTAKARIRTGLQRLRESGSLT
jgi:RNA polymerase sigma-70 factor (ECF subfamily)